MLSKNLMSGKCYRDGVEITAEEYSAAFEEIKAETGLANQLYKGEIASDAGPAEGREEIQQRVEERTAAESAVAEQDIPAEEALDIILGGETV